MSGTETDAPADLLTRIETAADKYSRFILPAILLLALFVRVIALLDLKQTLYFDFMLWDERLYHEWAKKLADGTFASGAVYEFAPVPAYLIALVYKLFSPDIVYIRYVNIALGIITCWLLYLTGKEIGGKAVGLAAALFAALYKPFIFYNIVPLKSSMTIVLFAAFVYFLIVLFNHNRLLAALCTGLFLGLVNNVRPNAVVLVPLVPLLIAWVRYKGKTSLKPAALLILFYAAGLGLAHTPFMIRNYQVAGRAAPVTSQGGFHIYMCNNFDYPKGIPFVTTSPSERGIQFTIEASRREGRKMNSKEASDYWTREALHSVMAHPGQYLTRQVQKARYICSYRELGEHYNLDFMSDLAPFFKLPFFAFWFIMPLGVAGMVWRSLQAKKYAALLLVFLTYAATLVLFFTSARMRMPLVVMLIPFAAAGLVELLHAARAKNFQKTAVGLAIIGLFTLISFMPPTRGSDLTAYLNTHAIILVTNGKLPEAMEYWKKSSQSEGRYAAFADLSLSGQYGRIGNLKKAKAHLDKIDGEGFAGALKYESLADLLLAAGRVREAIDAYEKAITINSGLRRVRAKLVRLLERVNPRQARMEYEKLKYIDSFYNLYGTEKPTKQAE